MDTFTPLWSQIVTSSIWSEPYYVRVLWLTMLAVKDRDYVVRKTAFALSRLGNMTEQEVLDGLRILSEPDTRRLEPQPHEGRRIEKVEDGWKILNGERYQSEMSRLFRRARNAEAMRERRENERKNKPMPRNEPTMGERVYQEEVSKTEGVGTGLESVDVPN